VGCGDGEVGLVDGAKEGTKVGSEVGGEVGRGLGSEEGTTLGDVVGRKEMVGCGDGSKLKLKLEVQMAKSEGALPVNSSSSPSLRDHEISESVESIMIL
jgi:hypothetical protein